MNQIKIEKNQVYLDKWLVGTIVKSFTEKRFFAANVDYCSPLDANNLRDLADKLDAMNGVSNEPA